MTSQHTCRYWSHPYNFRASAHMLLTHHDLSHCDHHHLEHGKGLVVRTMSRFEAKPLSNTILITTHDTLWHTHSPVSMHIATSTPECTCTWSTLICPRSPQIHEFTGLRGPKNFKNPRHLSYSFCLSFHSRHFHNQTPPLI